MTAKRDITRADIMSMEDFAAIRQQRRAEISAIKRHRRLAIGPDATIYFESYDTMWWQVHEMLYIEKGGEAQIKDELAAFNPLPPDLLADYLAGRRDRLLYYEKITGGDTD